MTASNRFQQGSLTLVKNKTTPDSWFFRFYEDAGDRRVYKKLKLGTVVELPRRRDAEQAVLAIRAKINAGTSSPSTVKALITHYQNHELTPARKSFSSIENHKTLTKLYIEPRWGDYKLTSVRTMEVEEWLDSLDLAPGSKTKIKSCFSVLYSHAIRHEWLTFNPICKVRTSSKTLRKKDILTPDEFQKLISHLSVRDRALVLLVGSTGARRSEAISLTWNDLDRDIMEVSIVRNFVRSRIKDTKTDASRRSVPLHPVVLDALEAWRRESLYPGDGDFLFPSTRLNGTKPLSPDSVLKKSIRPALERAGINGKVIGYHSFRHALSTYMQKLEVNVKTVQETLGHASSRFTLDVYTRAVSADKHQATAQLMHLLLPDRQKTAQHP